MAHDKERNLQTVIRPAEAEPEETGEEATAASMRSPFANPVDEATAAPMQSPFADKTAMHKDPVIGTSVSGYLVKGRLGSGGMGIVYEGEQQTIGKRVAIKVLRPEVAENPDVVQRLVAEARAVNSVGHRGIIDVFAFGELPDGRQCIVMEYLDGESLDHILDMYVRDRRLMPVGDVLIILDEILSALSAAHAAGVIHRDLKPSNIFLCKQRDGARYVKLLDFGIAKLGVLGNATPQSRASLMMGTPSYMSPEQAKGGVIGPAMDLYAVGVMAFEMFTGRLPFIADSVVAMLMAHQSEQPPAPSSLNMGLPDGVDEMVLKLLEKTPEARSQSADEVRKQVLKLKKEFADPTARRMQLEVTVSEKERASLSAKPVGPPAQSTPSEIAQTKAPLAPPPASSPPVAMMQTAVTAQPRGKHANKPEQVAQTARELKPALDQTDDTSEAIAPPRSKAPMIVAAVFALVVIAGLVVAFMPSGTAATEEPAAKPKAPVKVAKVEPPPPAKVEPAPAPVEPPPAPVEVAKVEPTPAPAPVEPPPAKVEPAPAPVEPPPAKVEPAKDPVAKPKVSKTSALATRLKKLDARLAKAAAKGDSVELYQKQVKKISDRLNDPALSGEERERLEAAVSRLEQSSDY